MVDSVNSPPEVDQMSIRELRLANKSSFKSKLSLWSTKFRWRLEVGEAYPLKGVLKFFLKDFNIFGGSFYKNISWQLLFVCLFVCLIYLISVW